MSVKEETQSIKIDDPRFQAMLAELEDAEGTASLRNYSEVLLLIGGAVSRVLVRQNQTYFLGRYPQPSEDQVDLNPFGALQTGVSRSHAKLLMTNDQLYVVDLDSTNGTYLHRRRLKPNEPSLLRKGDELLLARMRIQITFR
jgi:pSer/pThr/pTyr-binding forkhead associated (FHA) protein